MSNEFTAQTKSVIESRMVNVLREHTGSPKSTVEGMFSRDLINANAVEFENSYSEMALLKEAAFAETAWGEYLTMRAAEFGITRKRGVKAEGVVTVTGERGAYIIGHSLFQTPDGLTFYTKADATIPLSATHIDIPVEAGSEGVMGNVEAGTITEIPYSIPGVYSVINREACTDGADEETDEALLERLLFKVRQPITSGNANQYRFWAMSVDGVGNCRVLPLWNGNGTVKVIIVTTEGTPASTDLIQTVQAYIETQRPIGATVTVASPVKKFISLSATIHGTASQDRIRDTISAYLQKDGFGLPYVSLAHIGRLLLSVNGVTDYENLQLNGTGFNVPLTAEELPVLGEVKLRYVSS